MARANILRLIDHAARQRAIDVSPAIDGRVDLYRAAFDAVPGARPGSLSFFTFYAQVPDTHKSVAYVDTQHDHSLYDYQAILDGFVQSARRTNPGVHIYIVTDRLTEIREVGDDVVIVRLDMDARELMFERVCAMTAYVRSGAFTNDTVFLDTDAFAHGHLGSVFGDAVFDIGVTIRPVNGFYMPINEGVIYACHKHPDHVQVFFKEVLATYECLIGDEEVLGYYGDIKRWRGGQLSLNAVVAARGLLDAPVSPVRDEVRVKLLDCHDANYCVDDEGFDQKSNWQSSKVVHFKGISKIHISEYFRLQTRDGGDLF